MGEHMDFETLLAKYAGGKVPPLVDSQDPEASSINMDLLSIYHEGLMAKYKILLGILIAAPGKSGESKWRDGDFTLNAWAKPNWSPFCRLRRESTDGDKACERCDFWHAMMAERKQRTVAYLCDAGLVDFATPIIVKNKTVAMLFCGQSRPIGGQVWNQEFIQDDGTFRPLQPGERGVDASVVSQQRIELIVQSAESFKETLELPDPISPDEVLFKQQLLDNIAAQLSELATSNYDLQRRSVIDQIRERITDSLGRLGSAGDSDAVWRKLSEGLDSVRKFLALDYCLVLSSFGGTQKGLTVLCQAGLSEKDFPTRGAERTDEYTLQQWIEFAWNPQKTVLIKLRDLRRVPFIDRLARLHRRGQQYVVAIPLPVPKDLAQPVMILGRIHKEPEIESDEAQEALKQFVEGVAQVIEIVVLVEELEERARQQALFLENVAHNIRTPIQNVILEAELMTRTDLPAQLMERRARRIATQVRRLHIVSLNAWTLVNIDQKAFENQKKQHVSVFDTIMGQRKSLLDLARGRGIKITVDRELQDWPPIRVNPDLFSQTVLNLMDNAVKYSADETEVRIDGRRVPAEIVDGKPRLGGVELSFVNRGIPIKEDQKEKIFQRYYRTVEAKKRIPTGTGIGLAIVQAFLEHHDGTVKINSEPIPGTQHYVTEFRIFIPEGA